MKPIRLPELPASPRAMGGLSDIFQDEVDGVIRRAVIVGNGFSASENQSIRLVHALGLSIKHTLYVTRPRGGINEWLHWLSVSVHKKIYSIMSRLYGYSRVLFTGSGKKLIPARVENGTATGLSSVLEADVKSIVTMACNNFEKEGPLLVVTSGRDTVSIASSIRRLASDNVFVVQGNCAREFQDSSFASPSWTRIGFQVPPLGSPAWKDFRKEVDQHSPMLFNLPMNDLKFAAKVGPSILRRASTLDQVEEFKKLAPFNLLGVAGGVASLQASISRAMYSQIVSQSSGVEEKEKLTGEVHSLKAEVASFSQQLVEAKEKLGAQDLEVESLKAATEVKDTNLGKLKKSLMDEKAEVQRLRSKLAKKEQKHNEVVSSLVNELRYRRSNDFLKKFSDDFKKSKDFHDAVVAEATVFMDRGAAHMVRQLYPEINDPTKLARIFSSCFFEGHSRQGASFVPFSRAEVKMISDFDASLPEEERPSKAWIHPEVVRPHFFDYARAFTNARPVEEIVVDYPPNNPEDLSAPVEEGSAEPTAAIVEVKVPPFVDLDSLGL